MEGEITTTTLVEDLTCPHCLAEAATLESRIDVGEDRDSKPGDWVLLVARCRRKECGRLIVRLTKGMKTTGESRKWEVYTMQGASELTLYPKWPTSRLWPPEVPTDLAEMYSTAHKLLRVSPEASAAYSRRGVQATLRHPNGGNQPGDQQLVAEIKAIKGTLPTTLAEDLDTLREVGNFGAHPMKDTNTGAIEPVEPGEAEYSLEVLAELFEHYFIRTAARSRARDRVNRHRTAVGKKPI